MSYNYHMRVKTMNKYNDIRSPDFIQPIINCKGCGDIVEEDEGKELNTGGWVCDYCWSDYVNEEVRDMK